MSEDVLERRIETLEGALAERDRTIGALSVLVAGLDRELSGYLVKAKALRRSLEITDGEVVDAMPINLFDAITAVTSPLYEQLANLTRREIDRIGRERGVRIPTTSELEKIVKGERT